MALTFADLTTELSDRGFAHLSSTRLGRYINQARAELDRMFLWPYRETSTSGAAPLAISDLGVIQSVQATTNSSIPLNRADYGFLADTYGDLTLTGVPSFYYITWTSGTPTVAVFPVSTNSIAVRYWKKTPDLSGVQVPLAPDEFQYLIVDLAVRRANRDAGNDTASVQPEIDNAVAQMVEALPPGQQDGPDAYVGVSGASVDW